MDMGGVDFLGSTFWYLIAGGYFSSQDTIFLQPPDFCWYQLMYLLVGIGRTLLWVVGHSEGQAL